MFYANFVLAKKGPLAKVWLAAHWEKKLSKAHVFETDLQSSIESIISPKVKIALRTSGHLLLGVVRIYSRKTKYLLADCTEALIKIKMAFRPDVVDLPLDNQKAAISAITLPEFQEWEAMMNNMGTFDITATLQNNQCRVEEITMKEDLYSSRFLANDNFFGDTPFGETSEIVREEFDESNQQSINASVTANENDLKDRHNLSSNESNLELAMNDPMEDVGFGAGEGLDFLEDYGMGEMIEDIPSVKPTIPVDGVDELLDEVPLEDNTITEEQQSLADKLDKSDQAIQNAVAEMTEDLALDEVDFEKEQAPNDDVTVPEQPTELTTGIETTLFSRDTEAFALEPVDVTVGKEKKRKRKRKLVVDDVKIISSENIKKHIENSDDTVKPAVVAPSTRWRMDIHTTNISKTLFEPRNSKPVSFQSKKMRLNSMYAKNHTIKIPDDLALPSSSSQEEDDVLLEDPTDILRDGEDTAALLGETRNEITKDQDTTNIEDELEKNADEGYVIEDIQPIMAHMDVEMNDENEPIDLQVPPPFQLDVTDKIMENGIEDLTANELKDTTTEEEEIEGDQDKHDVQDKRWTKRTQQTLHMLNKATKKNDVVNFKDLTKKCNRKQAAHRFYTLLTLNKEKCITVKQDDLFADIFIERGERFALYV